LRSSITGQACIAGSRLILHESIVSDFLARFIGLAESIRLGNPLDPTTEMVHSRRRPPGSRAVVRAARRDEGGEC